MKYIIKIINLNSMIVKKPKKIGLDLDGVIVDLSLTKIVLAKKFGVDLLPTQTPANVFVEVVSKDIRDKIQAYLYEDPDIATQLPLMTHAFSGIEKIKKSGNQYYLLSQRKNPKMAINLLKKSNLWPNFFFEDNTFFVKDEVEKARVGEGLGIDYYVDDWLTVLNLFSFAKHRFLFDPLRVYSKRGDGHTTVYSWDDLIVHLIN